MAPGGGGWRPTPRPHEGRRPSTCALPTREASPHPDLPPGRALTAVLRQDRVLRSRRPSAASARPLPGDLWPVLAGPGPCLTGGRDPCLGLAAAERRPLAGRTPRPPSPSRRAARSRTARRASGPAWAGPSFVTSRRGGAPGSDRQTDGRGADGRSRRGGEGQAGLRGARGRGARGTGRGAGSSGPAPGTEPRDRALSPGRASRAPVPADADARAEGARAARLSRGPRMCPGRGLGLRGSPRSAALAWLEVPAPALTSSPLLPGPGGGGARRAAAAMWG